MPAKDRKKYPLVTFNAVTDERVRELERQAEERGCIDPGEYLRRLIDEREAEKRRQGA